MRYNTPIPYAADACAHFAAISDMPWAVWLDSGRLGRYDILSAQPVSTLVTHNKFTEITDSAGTKRITGDPLEMLRQQLGRNEKANTDMPFAGGALGYWGYDLARQWMSMREQAKDLEHLPEMAIGIYDWAIVLDHHKKIAQLVSHQRDPSTAHMLPTILERLQRSGRKAQSEFKVLGCIESNISRAQYQSAFATVKQYLNEGDCYQVNLAQRFAAGAAGDAFQAYLALRQISPAPYSAFLNLPHAQILSASPECFLNLRGKNVETRPIKGTRPRMNDASADAQMAQELKNSAKDRAENLMIVDLLRNDLGKSCVPGSVKVPQLFEVESYAHVHHLVSTITGQLAPESDALALLRDCFPGGSVTGTPKQRAMEIIEQLEPCRRGVYCGAIGYIGYDGNMDSNIAIRTLVYSSGEIRFWAGGGIIADSDAASEFQETLDKSKAMLEILRQFGGS